MGKRKAEEPEVIVTDEDTDAAEKKGAKKRGDKEGAKKKKKNSKRDKAKDDKEKKDKGRKKAPKRTDADLPKDDVREDSEGPSQDILDLTGTKVSSVSIQADYECDRGDIFIYDDVSPVHKLIQDYRYVFVTLSYRVRFVSVTSCRIHFVSSV